MISSSGRISTDAYLETELLRKAKEESEKINIKIFELSKLLNITMQEAENIINNQQVKSKFKRPDKVYNRVRCDIDLRIREDIVPDLAVKYLIPQKDKPLNKCHIFQFNRYRWIPDRISDEQGMLAVYFNQYLKKEIGQAREQWLISDFERANELLDNQIEYFDRILQEYYRKE